MNALQAPRAARTDSRPDTQSLALRALPFLITLAFASVAQAGPVTSASAGAFGSGSGCTVGPAPTQSTTSTASSSNSTATLSTGACNATAQAEASQGSLHVNAHAEGTNTVRNQFGQQMTPESTARATAGISETVDAIRFTLPPELQAFDFYVPVSLRVSGNVSLGASTLGFPATSARYLPHAAITYDATVQGRSFSGIMNVQTSGDDIPSVVGSQSGHFGILDFLLLISTLNNDTYSLSLNAAAGVEFFANGGGLPDGASGSATADFSHSLDWLGITGPIRAFNQAGEEAVLPAGFTIDMIGRETGFNYSHSSIVEVSPVPEPASGLLLLAGLGLIGWHSRRRGLTRGLPGR